MNEQRAENTRKGPEHDANKHPKPDVHKADPKHARAAGEADPAGASHPVQHIHPGQNNKSPAGG